MKVDVGDVRVLLASLSALLYPLALSRVLSRDEITHDQYSRFSEETMGALGYSN